MLDLISFEASLKDKKINLYFFLAPCLTPVEIGSVSCLSFRADFALQSWINGSECILMNETFYKHLSLQYLNLSPVLINLSIIYGLC